MSTPVQLLGAVLVAGVVLLVAVLPAEYGIDPTGLGEAFGLTQLAPADTTEARALTHWLDDPDIGARFRPMHQEERRFELGPFESKEYKYRLQAGDGLLYRWRSSGPVVVNFHSEPDDVSHVPAGEEAAVSFNNGRSEANSGTYLAPFDGIHGWFWQNRGANAVTLTLSSSGFFSAAIEYRDGFPFEQSFTSSGTPTAAGKPSPPPE